ncbi:hypothetical protein GCM10025879_04950 [Leuconostoc litchii]|uniref:DUF1801 domain-containing protein n=1 Tax=Leuconostoc litchii TaxID=1981069 RepID=A0A6P2CNX7_9LACO|nr:hypothetical protein [Leuconostoc litchii]TYC47264.1 hypothetical protein ESZ47_03755 [Leuconostoc litchii]GMA69249.1 hypothetical protein GCM10025879_04950 [Leuconostoc litchii]
MNNKKVFSDFEREAMRERAQELRKAKNTEADVLEKISEMTDDESLIAMEIHHLVQKIAPELQPKTWYSMPAYANKDGKVIFFFQPATKFKARYSTIGFNDVANLDNGDIWATSFAIKKMTPDTKETIKSLIQKSIQK